MKRSTFKRRGAVPTWKRPRKPKVTRAPKKQHEDNCGFALYGPPAICTCKPKLDVPKALGKSAINKSPWRSAPYRLHVRTEFACLTCRRPAEHAHHIRECLPRTMGVRVSDKYVVPLCERCHSALHKWSRDFWMERHVSPASLLTWCESVHARWSAT